MHKYTRETLYFLVKYQDSDLRIPIIETLLFDRESVNEDGDGRVVFRRLSAETGSPSLALGPAEAAQLILDGKQLIEQLSKCFAGTLSSVDKSRR